MIQFGTTLQDKGDTLPKEIAEWLYERNIAFPNVDFEVNCYETRQEDRALIDKYSRSFASKNIEKLGIEQVAFLYGKESWNIRIKGLTDKTGRILTVAEADALDPFSLLPIPAEIRNAIVGLGTFSGLVEQKDGDWTIYLLPRKEGELVSECADDYIKIQPGSRYTSEMTISGTELDTLMSNPTVKKELLEATDWDQVREIRKRNEN